MQCELNPPFLPHPSCLSACFFAPSPPLYVCNLSVSLCVCMCLYICECVCILQYNLPLKTSRLIFPPPLPLSPPPAPLSSLPTPFPSPTYVSFCLSRATIVFATEALAACATEAFVIGVGLLGVGVEVAVAILDFLGFAAVVFTFAGFPPLLANEANNTDLLVTAPVPLLSAARALTLFLLNPPRPFTPWIPCLFNPSFTRSSSNRFCTSFVRMRIWRSFHPTGPSVARRAGFVPRRYSSSPPHLSMVPTPPPPSSVSLVCVWEGGGEGGGTTHAKHS